MLFVVCPLFFRIRKVPREYFIHCWRSFRIRKQLIYVFQKFLRPKWSYAFKPLRCSRHLNEPERDRIELSGQRFIDTIPPPLGMYSVDEYEHWRPN